MLTIYGVPFSAHTRKVILTARHKGIDYQLEPVVPLSPPDDWSTLSPTGTIPACRDDDLVLSDSSVICAYLEKKYPQKALYPRSDAGFARALWFEEFVDGNLQQFVLKHFLLETVFAPAFLQKETDWDVVNQALDIEIPNRFAQLETWVRADQFLVENTLSIADITLTSILINYRYGGQKIDEARFPKLSAYFDFMVAQPLITAGLHEEAAAASSVPGFDLSWLSVRESYT